MSDLSGQFKQILRVAEHPDTDRAAVRAVLHRVDTGLLSREDAVTVLQALGLRPSEDGGKYRAFGQRESQTPRRRRRRAQIVQDVSDLSDPPEPSGAAERRSAGAGEPRNGQATINGGAQ